MKKLLTILTLLIALSPFTADAVNVTVPSSPGLGSTLYGKANGNYTTLTVGANGDCLKLAAGIPSWASCGAGGGGGTDGNWSFFNGSGIRLATTTNQVLIGASATSTLAALEIRSALGFLNTGSTTLQNFTALFGTTTQGTTTSFAITGISSALLKTNAAGSVLAAVSGTDYSNFGASVGPTELQATDFGDWTCNGTTCSLDTAYQPLDSTLTSFAAYNTNGILTQTAADTFTGRTINGTTNRLDVTNGNGVAGNPTLDISSTYVGQASITTLGTITTGTWTGTDIAVADGGTGASNAANARTNLGLVIGTDVLAPGGALTGTFDGQEGTYYLDRTNHTGTQAASTITGGTFGAGSFIFPSGTLTSLGSTTLQNFTATNGTTTNATSTNLTVSGTTRFSGLNCSANANGGALTTDANGFVSCSDDDSSAGSGSYPFPVAGNATSTLTQFNGGLTAYSSSTITSLTVTNGTTTNATTTNLTVSGVTSALHLAGTDGKVSAYAGSTCGSNTKATSISATGVVTCSAVANADLTNSSITINGVGISGGGAVSLGSSLTLTALATTSNDYYDSLFRDWSVQGSGAYLAPTTSRPILVNNGTSTITNLRVVNGTTTNATSTNLNISGTLDVDNITSALALGGATGIIGEYAGTSCTNQFPRSQDAAGAWTCATVANTDLANSTISGISLGGTLANLTATDGTLTFSGTYTGATARTIGLNLGNANTWTALQTFQVGLVSQASSTITSLQVINGTTTNATSTNLSISSTGELFIPSAANPTVGTAREFGIESTAASTSLRFHDGTAERAIFASYDRSFSFASSTLAYQGAYGAAGTTTILLSNPYRPVTLLSFYCKTNSGTAYVGFGNGTATTTQANCSTSGVEVNPASNNTWNMRENFLVEVGRITGTPSNITITATLRDNAD